MLSEILGKRIENHNKMFNRILTNRGSSVLIVLALIAMLTSVAIMSVERANTDLDISYNQANEEKAFYVAEAGIERAIVDLNENNAWRTGYYKQILSGGNYTVSVIDSTVNAAIKDTVILASVGVFMEGISNIEVWLVPGKNYPYRYAAFGDKSLLLENYACTDSYNSDSGTYAATQDTLGGDMGTNGSALLKNNVEVGGNLSTAQSGGITFENSADVLGDTTSRAPSQTYNLATDADYAWAQAHNSAPSGFVGTGYNYSSGNLEIKSNKSVSLKSGTYYFNSISLKNVAKLNLEPGANVRIYIIGALLIENNSTFNSTGVPSQLSIFTKGTVVDIKNNVTLKGTVYAPNCNFVHENNAEIFGAFIAKSINIKNSGCIHFDRSLSKIAYGTDGTLRQVAWKQTE